MSIAPYLFSSLYFVSSHFYVIALVVFSGETNFRYKRKTEEEEEAILKGPNVKRVERKKNKMKKTINRGVVEQ